MSELMKSMGGSMGGGGKHRLQSIRLVGHARYRQ